jgi:hypothetical protein
VCRAGDSVYVHARTALAAPRARVPRLPLTAGASLKFSASLTRSVLLVSVPHGLQSSELADASPLAAPACCCCACDAAALPWLGVLNMLLFSPYDPYVPRGGSLRPGSDGYMVLMQRQLQGMLTGNAADEVIWSPHARWVATLLKSSGGLHSPHTQSCAVLAGNSTALLSVASLTASVT